MSAGGGQRPEKGRGGAIDQLIDRGLERYARGDLDGALGEWRGVLVLDPDNRRAQSYVRYLEEHYEALADRFAAARTVRTDEAADGSAVLVIEAYDGDEATGAGAGDDDYDALELELGPAGGSDPSAARPHAAELELADLDAGWSLEDGWGFDGHAAELAAGARGATPSLHDRLAHLDGLALDDVDDRSGPDEQTAEHAAAPRSRRASREETIERSGPPAAPATFDLSELELAPPSPGPGDEDQTHEVRIADARPAAEPTEQTALPAGMLGLADDGGNFDDETMERPRTSNPYMAGRDDGRAITEADGDDEGTQAPTGFYQRISPAGAHLGAPGTSAALRADLLAELDDTEPPTDDDDSLRRRLTWLTTRARDANQRGQHATAVIAVELALDEQPDSAVAQKVVHQQRELFGQIYRDFLGDPEGVPGLAIPLGQLAGTPLDHRAAFLVSRVDGGLSVEDLLDVAGMPRLEASRHLCRLVLEGIVQIR